MTLNLDFPLWPHSYVSRFSTMTPARVTFSIMAFRVNFPPLWPLIYFLLIITSNSCRTWWPSYSARFITPLSLYAPNPTHFTTPPPLYAIPQLKPLLIPKIKISTSFHPSSKWTFFVFFFTSSSSIGFRPFPRTRAFFPSYFVSISSHGMASGSALFFSWPQN